MLPGVLNTRVFLYPTYGVFVVDSESLVLVPITWLWVHLTLTSASLIPDSSNEETQ